MSNRVQDNQNFIDDVKGRKLVITSIRYIGQITLIDLSIIFISVVASIGFFFINLLIGFVFLVIFLIISTALIMEVKNLKLYERFYFYIKHYFSDKNIESDFLSRDNENVYEILSGFDIENMSLDDYNKLNISFNEFLDSIKGRVKFFKLNSTLRLNEISQKYENLTKQKFSNGIIESYKLNVDEFSNKHMPNFYVQFLDLEEPELLIAVNKFSTILNMKKMKENEWKFIKHQNLSFTKSFKINTKTFQNDSEEEFAIGKMIFERNVPSYFLQNLIINPNVSFAVELKNPNYKEKEEIKKSIKRWSKSIQSETFDQMVGKDFFETLKNKEKSTAKSEIMLNNIISGDEIKLINGYVLIKNDKNSEISFKKQLNEINWKSEKIFKWSIDTVVGKQLLLLSEFFLKESNETNWYPTNVSTVTNSVMWQNQSFLDADGAYIGTVNNIFPFVFDAWKTGSSGRHMGILAKTGAGKTILMKKLILSDQVLANSKQYVLDPKNDGFDKVILDRFGGLSINVYDYPINPLAIIGKNMITDKDITEKAIEIKEWLYILFKKELEYGEVDISIAEFSEVIKKFLYRWYIIEKRIEEPNFESLWTFSSQNSKYNKFLNIIENFINGIYSRFNTVNEKLDYSRSIVFNLHEVLENPSEELTNAIMFQILNKVIDEIYYREDKYNNVSLWIDEAGDFFKSEFLTKKMEKLMVKSRSFNTKICWATQNPTDLIDKNNKMLNSIFSNTEHLFIGQLKDSQIGAINDMLNMAEGNTLSEIEKKWIADSTIEEDKGKFLYFNSNQRYRIRSDYLNDFVFRSWNEQFKLNENRG